MRLKHLVIAVLFCVQFSAAAQATAPLVIHIDGQIYVWSPGESEARFTGCDLSGNRLRRWNYSLTQSADGQWAAFMVLPEDMEDSAPSPTGNLWVCNLNTGEAYALSDARPEYPYTVSEGAFSPDGSRIIWTEIDDQSPDVETADLFVHEFSTKQTRVLVEDIPLDQYCGIGTGAPHVIWGAPGIAVGYAEKGILCDPNEVHGFAHYAEDGTPLNAFPVNHAFYDEFVWLAGDEPIIAYVGFAEGSNHYQHYTLNMVTGEVRAENAVVEAFIPDGGADAGAYVLGLSWDASEPLHITLPAASAPPVLETQTDAALSPDGRLMAILLGRTLYFAENGTLRPATWNLQYFPISDADERLTAPDYRQGQFEIAWANPSYRLVPTPETVCPSVEQLTFSRGGGRVVDGLGENNVRSAPLTTAEKIGSLPEGAVVRVIDTYDFSPFQAPPVEVCTAGIRWREILLEDALGWTAESQGDTYYLEYF